MSHSNPPEPSLAPFDWRDALSVIRRYKRRVIGTTLAGLGVAALFAFGASPMYRAKAVIRVVDTRSAVTGGLGDGPVAGPQARSADPLLSLVQVLGSRATAGRVVDSTPGMRLRVHGFPADVIADLRFAGSAPPDSLRLLFHEHVVRVRGSDVEAQAPYGAPIQAGSLRFAITRRPDAEEGTLRFIGRDAAISALLGGLRAVPRPNTDVVDVYYMSSDPDWAKEVVNRVVTMFRKANAEAAQQQSRLRRQFIESQLALNDSLLADARLALAAFRRRARSGPPGQVPGDIEALRTRRAELAVDRRTYAQWLVALRDTAAGSRAAALRAALASPVIAGHPITAQLAAQLTRYESTRDSLAGGVWGSTAAHPDVQRLDALIRPTEARLRTAVVSVVEGETQALDARMAALDGLIAGQVAAVREAADTLAQESRLAEQVETTRGLGDELRGEYQRAKIAEAAEVGQVEIVDLATRPRQAQGVGWARMLAYGLLLGLLLGGGWAFAADRLNTSILRSEQIAALGLPVLGVVPHVNGLRVNGRRRQPARLDPGPLVEALRGIRINLARSHEPTSPLVVTVTSPGSRDGKSFVSANLAQAYAFAGRRTLLVDADVRRGALHRTLSLERRPGLTDFLLGTVSTDNVVQPTRHKNLYFVGSGTRMSDAPDLLGSDSLGELLAHFRSRFDVVVVDSAPLGAGVDAVSLGTVTGNVVVVLRLGMTNRELAAVTLDLLRPFPTRLLGAVLNDARGQLDYQYVGYYMDGYGVEDERPPRPKEVTSGAPKVRSMPGRPLRRK